MKVDKTTVEKIAKHLAKISTYARKESVSIATVNNRIKDGKIESVKIDGVAFVIVK